MTVVAETFIFRGSSNLAEATYDPDVENLDITFQDGSEYVFYNVPVSKYKALTQAPSAGSYFHRHIEGQHGYESKG